jgi:hypothetical protein
MEESSHTWLKMSSERCRDWIYLVRFHQMSTRQSSGYDITINTLHRVDMSNCAHFGVEFTEKPTKTHINIISFLQQESTHKTDNIYR